MKRWFIYLPFALSLLYTVVLAQGERIDAYAQTEMAKSHTPGLSIAVVQGGRVVFVKGYGMANVELSVHANADTVYELLSVGKQFTATAIMMLVEEGKISLDSKISTYVPEAAGWGGITVRHLLSHT